MLPREIAMASSRWRMRERAMKMNNTLFAMGAALAVMLGASPASARIFQYTSNSTGDTLTVNTLTGTGTFNNGLANLRFTSNNIYNFTGGLNTQFSFTFSSLSGSTDCGNVVNTNLANVGRGAPRITGEGSNPISIILRGVRFEHCDGDENWGPVFLYLAQDQGGK